MAAKSSVRGIVTSDKMDKTVVVAVERQVRHALYGKIQRRTSKFMAHDEDNAAHVGDLVEIVESRPLSRHKRWVVTRILQRANEAGGPVEASTAGETPEAAR
jgi:small subunit ribosomal protein S17